MINDIDATTINFYAMYEKELDLNNNALNLHDKTFTIHKNVNIIIKNGMIVSEVNKEGTSALNVRATGRLIAENIAIKSDTAAILLTAEVNSKIELINSTVTLTTAYGKALYIKGETGNTTEVTVDEKSVVSGNYGIVVDGVGSNKDASGITLNLYGTSKGTKSPKQGGMALTINGLVSETTGEVPVINIYDTAVLDADSGVAIYGAGYGI